MQYLSNPRHRFSLADMHTECLGEQMAEVRVVECRDLDADKRGGLA